MSKFPTRRLAAATVLAAVLSVLALPAAAAPAGTWSPTTWELPTFLSWFDALWTDWFGTPAAPAETEAPTGPSTIHAGLKGMLEPDGVSATAQLSSDGGESTLRSLGGN